jgi:RimJ/RimL family protein N-acetyltransferase
MATNPDFKGTILLNAYYRGFAVAPLVSLRMSSESKTERLIFRPLEIADARQMQTLFPQWEIVRYLLNRVPWPYPPDGALLFCRDIALPQVARGKAWHWTIRLATEPSQMIGLISLFKGDWDNRKFWLGLPWQGHGLMSEACEWVNDFWFDTLGFPILRVAKAISNIPSRRISVKQGMRVVTVVERDYVSGPFQAEVWELTADEWHAWKARG